MRGDIADAAISAAALEHTRPTRSHELRISKWTALNAVPRCEGLRLPQATLSRATGFVPASKEGLYHYVRRQRRHQRRALKGHDFQFSLVSAAARELDARKAECRDVSECDLLESPCYRVAISVLIHCPFFPNIHRLPRPRSPNRIVRLNTAHQGSNVTALSK